MARRRVASCLALAAMVVAMVFGVAQCGGDSASGDMGGTSPGGDMGGTSPGGACKFETSQFDNCTMGM